MTPDQLRKPSNKKPGGGSGGGGQGAIRGKRVLPAGSASAATALTLPTPSANSNSNSQPPNSDLIINNVNDKKPDLGSPQAGVLHRLEIEASAKYVIVYFWTVFVILGHFGSNFGPVWGYIWALLGFILHLL